MAMKPVVSMGENPSRESIEASCWEYKFDASLERPRT